MRRDQMVHRVSVTVSCQTSGLSFTRRPPRAALSARQYALITAQPPQRAGPQNSNYMRLRQSQCVSVHVCVCVCTIFWTCRLQVLKMMVPAKRGWRSVKCTQCLGTSEILPQLKRNVVPVIWSWTNDVELENPFALIPFTRPAFAQISRLRIR